MFRDERRLRKCCRSSGRTSLRERLLGGNGRKGGTGGYLNQKQEHILTCNGEWTDYLLFDMLSQSLIG